MSSCIPSRRRNRRRRCSGLSWPPTKQKPTLTVPELATEVCGLAFARLAPFEYDVMRMNVRLGARPAVATRRETRAKRHWTATQCVHIRPGEQQQQFDIGRTRAHRL